MTDTKAGRMNSGDFLTKSAQNARQNVFRIPPRTLGVTTEHVFWNLGAKNSGEIQGHKGRAHEQRRSPDKIRTECAAECCLDFRACWP